MKTRKNLRHSKDKGKCVYVFACCGERSIYQSVAIKIENISFISKAHIKDYSQKITALG